MRAIILACIQLAGLQCSDMGLATHASAINQRRRWSAGAICKCDSCNKLCLGLGTRSLASYSVVGCPLWFNLRWSVSELLMPGRFYLIQAGRYQLRSSTRRLTHTHRITYRNLLSGAIFLFFATNLIQLICLKICLERKK